MEIFSAEGSEEGCSSRTKRNVSFLIDKIKVFLSDEERFFSLSYDIDSLSLKGTL